jgi:predicted flap endonuclease-1-like 5' DNA nuclease
MRKWRACAGATVSWKGGSPISKGGAGEAETAEKTGAEAMLEELEVTDTAADMTEAVEAMAEGLTVAGLPDEAEPEFVEVEDEASEEVAFETLAETGTVDVEVVDEEDTALIEEDAPAAFVEESAEPLEAEDTGPEEDESFEDVSDDEEESLAEADHADEDVLSDEEYDEEDFVEADDVEEEYDADADEADAFDDDDAEDDDFEDDDVEDDEEASDEQDETYDEEESWDEDDEAEDDFEDDEDTGSEEDEAYDDTEAFDDDEDEAEDEDESHEEDEVSDEAWDDEEDDADEDDASGEANEDEAGDEPSEGGVTYEADDTIVPERPMAMNGPVEGHPDDLTLIGGIGPKIQVLLNELGVWHYDQIAEWTPENVAWMDEHLNFGGRITREGWVEQAAVLVRDAESV